MRPEIAELIRILIEHRGKVCGTFFGFIVGIIVIFYGWFDAISFAVCVIAGYLLGKQVDKKESLREFFERVLPPIER
ncbi:MAG TPA: DUF2273 domain-containing protein [Firmicutes bacterium]|nr:DUF2273 domain-containing protein [Bacillota bacterium]